MTIAARHSTLDKPLHDWLHRVNAAWVTGPSTPLLDRLLPELLDRFRREGHLVQDAPGNQTEILLTTGPFLEPLNWRDSVMFTGRRRFNLNHAPTSFTFMQATPTQFQDALDRFEGILRPASPHPDDFAFPGLATSAYHTLYEQGKRGGPFGGLQGNEKFPDMKKLCDDIHTMGLKAGIYSTPWITSYAKFAGGSSDNRDGQWDKTMAGAKFWRHGKFPFASADAKQWAAWGFDYLKYDWNPNDVPHVAEMSKALRACKRDIIYSLSNSAPFDMTLGATPSSRVSGASLTAGPSGCAAIVPKEYPNAIPRGRSLYQCHPLLTRLPPTAPTVM